MIHQGELFKKIIKSKKINITQLAQDIGVSKQTIHSWFKLSIIPNQRLETIIKILDLQSNYFYPNKDEAKIVKNFASTQLNNNSTIILVELDGSDQQLEKVIRKLNAINLSLKEVH